MRYIALIISLFFLSVIGVQAATFTVTKTADTSDGTCDADCSLREAVVAANANAGADTIEFNIPTSDPGWNTQAYPDAFVLTLTSINLTETVTINGLSQTEATGNTNKAVSEPVTGEISDNSSTGPEIIIDGQSNNSSIFQVMASDIVIKGIGFYNNNPNTSSGNRTIQARDGADNLTITKNTFVGNGGGVFRNLNDIENFVVTENVFRGNKHGAMDVLELQFGQIDGALIANNTFVGNQASAIYLSGHQGNPIIIKDNLFKANGQNTTEGKAHIYARLDNTAEVIIESNTFTHSPTQAIVAKFGSYLTIKNNYFYNNQGMGIDIAPDASATEPGDGHTPNDPGDTDTGPNDLMNHPVILEAEYRGDNKYHLFANLDGNPLESPYTIEVCQSSNHSSGYGGCVKTLKTFTIQERGNFEVDVTLETNNLDNLPSFTMLATNASGSTSEFGPNYQAKLSSPIPEPIIYQPDIRPDQGGLTHRPEISTITHTGTFAWDVYLDHQIQRQVGAYRIPGTRYWQAGDVHQLWWRSYFNQARVMPELIARPYIVVMRYDRNQIDPNLPETNLRIAYSADEGQTWRILPGTVHNMETQTVATVTKQGGHFMLVSGY